MGSLMRSTDSTKRSLHIFRRDLSILFMYIIYSNKGNIIHLLLIQAQGPQKEEERGLALRVRGEVDHDTTNKQKPKNPKPIVLAERQS